MRPIIRYFRVPVAWRSQPARVVAATVMCLGIVACGGGDGTSPPAVTAVGLAPTVLTITGFGNTGSLTASLTPSSASAAVTWRSDDPSIATVTGSGTSATVTAVGGGTTRVTASVGAISGSASITVTPAVRSIAITSPIVSLAVGSTSRIVPIVTADAGASQTMSYVSSANTVASVASDGTITGLTVGTATITVSSVAFPAATATVQVTVTLPVVRSVVIGPNTPTIARGATRQLNATVDVNAGTSTAVTWMSTTPAVASISASGLLTAVAVGTTTIRATSNANPGVSGTLAITVTTPTVRGIVLGPNPASVPQFGTLPITATIDADVGANTAIDWSTTNAGVVQISAAGVVTGVAQGSATIRATSQLVPSVTSTLLVTVGISAPLTIWSARTTLPPSTVVNSDLLGVHSLANGTAWAVPTLLGNDRRMLRFDGTTWSAVNVAPFGDLTAIGGAVNAAWLGSGSGAVARLNADGQTWQLMSSPANTPIIRIVGINATTAIVATSTNIYSVNGDVWTTLPAVGMSIVDVAANATNDIAAVGPLSAGVIATRRWNGTIWTGIPNPSLSLPLEFVALRGSLITVTSSIANTFATNNGAAWTTGSFPATRAGTTESIGSLVTCASELYAGSTSGRVFRLDGITWTTIADYGVAPLASPQVILGCGANGVLRAVGNAGSISRYTGTGWIAELASPPIKRLVMVRADLAYATTGNGMVTRWDGTRWNVDRVDITNSGDAPGSVNNGLTGLSVAPDGTVMASGTQDFFQPYRIFRRTPAGVWSSDVVNAPCRDVYVASSTFALAVGYGLVAGPQCALRWNGSSWVNAGGGLPHFIYGMHGSSATFAVAAGKTIDGLAAISHWDGTAWSPKIVPSVVGELLIVRVFSPTLAYASNSLGLLRWNGTIWEIVTKPAGLTFITDISINAPNDVYAVTGTGELYRFDGTTWTRIMTLPNVFDAAFRPGVLSLSTVPGFGIVGLSGGIYLHSSSIGALSAARR